jgi:lipopolysaccharide heptosyltransferase II
MNPRPATPQDSPILIVPYMWIGDFVRCHSVVKLLRTRWPDRPVDLLTSKLCAPLLDYMPGVRQGIVWDLPRRSLPFGQYRALAETLRKERYGTALIMLRTWKSALAPFLAGVPERVGFAGEARFGLLNDLRFGERNLERMIDRMGALALPKGAELPVQWPLPELVVPKDESSAWLARRGLTKGTRPIVTMAPGAVGPGKAWPPEHYADLARQLAASGADIWVLGGPNEKTIAGTITAAGGAHVKDLTGTDLRDAIIAMRLADAAVTNDSGLMHIAAALNTPTIAIFGPTSPRLWSPLNPLAAVIEPPGEPPTEANIKQRSTADVEVQRVLEAVQRTLAERPMPCT